VIGGGSWGTALSVVLAPRFERVRLWVYEQDLAERMRASRVNDVFLPGATLPPNIEITSSLPGAVEDAEIVLGVMPSHHARRVYDDLLPYLDENMLFVSATKGIENGTLLRMSQVLNDVVGNRFPPRVGVLSGPTFAKEVARGEPAAIVIASHDISLARAVQEAFSCTRTPIRWASRSALR
jgi:glycerol-3-phosphate dehydrogenase (NAD(P)+)